jgi:hypothetical protein
MSNRRRNLVVALALTLSAASIVSTTIFLPGMVHGHTAAVAWSHTPAVEEEEKIPTAWCILDDVNSNPNKFRHFPHASQVLLPCWSYFCRVRAREKNSNLHCGFWLNSSKLQMSQGWVEGLVKAMNCSVLNRTASQPDLTFHHRLKPMAEQKQWFQHKEDAAALCSLTVGSLTLDARPRIGLVQRASRKQRGNRRILNLDTIQESIKEAFPHASVETALMDGMSFSEQAAWWSSRDVVVAAHGASMSNVIFMRDNASVVEIYPEHYYPITFFRSLSRSAGVSHYGYYNGVANPYADYRQHRKTVADRKRYRNVDWEPPPQDVLRLVQLALQGGKEKISEEDKITRSE